MANLRPVTLDDIASAPILVHVTSTVAAPRQRVFDLVTGDPARWGDFVSALDHEGHWVTETPSGVGSVRRIGRSGVRLTETVLAKDDGTRWAFRVDTVPVPVVKALLEDYVFTDAPNGGCTVNWVGAVWPVGPAALARPVVSASLSLVIKQVFAGVDRVARASS